MDTHQIHPATEWEQDARRPYPQKISLRLAAMAGHMRLDKIAALIDLLADFVRRLRETHYHVDEISVNRAMSGGFFNVIHLGYHIKTDFYVPVEPELKTMIADRTYLPFDEIRRAAYVTSTAVVIAKLRAFENSQSTRHLDDIASIIRLQGKRWIRNR